MGRIFLMAGAASGEGIPPSLTGVMSRALDSRDLILLRDLVMAELRSRKVEVLSVPDDLGAADLGAADLVRWINGRSRKGDGALALQGAVEPNPAIRGTVMYSIASNSDRKQQGELMLLALTRRVPQLAIQGVLPDTHSSLGSLPFCRQLVLPSLYLQLGYLTNPEDRSLLENRRQELAIGIADGLVAWSRTLSGQQSPTTPPSSVNPSTSVMPPALETYASIPIHLNGRLYGEQGISINGNAYIPVDLVDRLGVPLASGAEIRRVSYGNVVYVKAIDLRDADISVSWDSATRTVSLRSILQIGRYPHQITGKGYTSEVQLQMFLRSVHEAGLAQFPDIARLYRDEGANEGINHDIAFAQMCVETSFLRFGGGIQASQNNFGGLGSTGAATEGASFPSARIGVRAHIQHLKAYASTEPLREEVVDPRFHLVTRGVAGSVEQLTGRWSADAHYGDRLLAILRQLYEASGLL